MCLLAIEILKEKSQDIFQIFFLLGERWQFPMEMSRNGIQSKYHSWVTFNPTTRREWQSQICQSWCLQCLKCTSIFGGSTPPGWRYIIEGTRDSKIYFHFLLFAGGGAYQCVFFSEQLLGWGGLLVTVPFLWYKWISRKEQLYHLWEFLGIDSQQSHSDIGNQWNFGGLNTRTKQ